MSQPADPGGTFTVLTTYSPDEFGGIAALAARALEYARTAQSRHEGFLGFRVFTAEDGASLVTLADWVSRDAFEAFRVSDEGRDLVAEAVVHHPKIVFLISRGGVTT